MAKTSENGKKWLKREMRPYRAFVLFLTVLSVLSTGISLAFAYLTRYLINSASAGDKKRLILFSCLLLGLLLLRILLQTANRFLSEKGRARIVAQLRTKIYAKILRSDYAEVQKYHSGELLNRLTADVQEIATDTVGLLPSLVGMIVQCLGAIVALLTIDPFFTLVYVVCGGMFGGITAFFRRQIKKRQKEVLEADGKSRAYMQEGISSLMTVKAYGAEERAAQKGETLANVYYKKRIRRSVLHSTMGAVFTLLSNFGLIFAVVWCSVSVLHGNDDYGSILSVILLLMQLQHPFSAFSAVIPVYYSRLASGERLSEIEDIPVELLSSLTTGVEIYEKLQTIDFERISFDYGREPVFTEASASVRKGETVCLTGASGAGKSTLFRLLLSVYAPTKGGVRLVCENEDIALSAKERGLFAYVPQGNFLFSGSIYENLTFFAEETEEGALKDKINEALQIACAEFVHELPQGLNTPLLEKGAGLSEGQLQRLAVARAILSDRPILLLDEATSALDSDTEKRLLENIKSLKNKTCFIVTHRPAALSIADRVLCIQDGKIVENE